MIFNSFEFLWLMPVVFALYWGVTLRRELMARWPELGNALLLIIGYGLYIKWRPAYALILLWVTAVTYVAGRVVEGATQRGRRLHAMWSGVALAAVPLLVFKYYNFVNAQLTAALEAMGVHTGLPGLNWVLPLGISFYTFQAIGYVADVYHKRIAAERNWWHYMLFVSFFPQVAAGPIGRAGQLLPQIKAQRTFDAFQATQGLRWLLWGMFMKVVMADRLGIYVDTVYRDVAHQSGLSCAVATVMYAFQIYGDFAGYSFMALGVGKLLGFELINNFRRPYLSASVTEFWHRWHISLSTWLRDYVYIPLGGSRCSRARNYVNIMITFVVSGLWHGANWTFIVWGALHGVLQVIEKALGLHRRQSHGVERVLRVAVTFVLVNAGWIFFRMPSMGEAWQVITTIATNHDTALAFAAPSMWLFMWMSLAIVIVKDLMDEFCPQRYTLLDNHRAAVRWTTYAGLCTLLMLCGVFDASQFIYAGF